MGTSDFFVSFAKMERHESSITDMMCEEKLKSTNVSGAQRSFNGYGEQMAL